MIQIKTAMTKTLIDGTTLGSNGPFHRDHRRALISVRVQKFFTDANLVIKLPENVPPVVYESFLSLSPLLFLVLVFWIIRFVLGVDINGIVQTAFQPLVFALNTLPGILVYALLVTLLWSVGINGDNAMDAIVAPIFLQYLAANVEAVTQGQPLPYVTAYGFFTTFVNVGGTGATIGLALVLCNSKEPGFRKVSRLSLPTQIFQINEPIFFGIPIVLNPIFMMPVHSQRTDPDNLQLLADGLERDQQTIRQRAVDDAADHRALPCYRRRLESSGLGSNLHRDCHAGLLSVCQSRGTPTTGRRVISASLTSKGLCLDRAARNHVRNASARRADLVDCRLAAARFGDQLHGPANVGERRRANQP